MDRYSQPTIGRRRTRTRVGGVFIKRVTGAPRRCGLREALSYRLLSQQAVVGSVAKKEAPSGFGADQPVYEQPPLTDRIVTELDLLSRNVDVLERVDSSNPIGIIRLSEAMQLPIHKVRYSLHVLERERMIQPSVEGAVVTERAKDFWDDLERGLDRMTEAIQYLKERVVEQRTVTTPPGSRVRRLPE
jgi:predicted transcriptional regulator